MNYLDSLARTIQQVAEPRTVLSDHYLALYRIYAVLLLAKGNRVTRADVHNAWVAWADPQHRSSLPYTALTPAVRALDKPYTDAIHRVWEQRRAVQDHQPQRREEAGDGR